MTSFVLAFIRFSSKSSFRFVNGICKEIIMMHLTIEQICSKLSNVHNSIAMKNIFTFGTNDLNEQIKVYLKYP